MNEITYYFGAGASCKSMPLVADFEDRFSYFISYVSEVGSLEKNEFIEIGYAFLNSISSHLSFDTFFKKLFHQKEHDYIRKCRALILIYFIFEHLIEVNSEVLGDKRMRKKKNEVDPRYEALVAGLLKPIKNLNEFHAKINFITWNYDAHITEALRSFLHPQELLFNFIKNNTHNKNEITCADQMVITHLNGYVNHPFLNDGTGLTKNRMDNILNDLIKDFFSHNGKIYTYSQYLSFSWENLSYEDSKLQLPIFVKTAREAIKRSQNLVITGYSFPLYNRLVDSYLLNQDTLGGKSIFIQDPNAIMTKEVLQNDLGVYDDSIYPNSGKPITQIKAITSCDSFFVPNTIFFQRTLGDL